MELLLAVIIVKAMRFKLVRSCGLTLEGKALHVPPPYRQAWCLDYGAPMFASRFVIRYDANGNGRMC